MATLTELGRIQQKGRIMENPVKRRETFFVLYFISPGESV